MANAMQHVFHDGRGTAKERTQRALQIAFWLQSKHCVNVVWGTYGRIMLRAIKNTSKINILEDAIQKIEDAEDYSRPLTRAVSPLLLDHHPFHGLKIRPPHPLRNRI